MKFLKTEEIQVGSVWRSCDGTGITATVSRVEGKRVYYLTQGVEFWKDGFHFQVRYSRMEDEQPVAPERSCDSCGNKSMDMDMDPYCAAVNLPWGKVLHRGRPEECGPDGKLYVLDVRRARVGRL
jgi:hypothetical protein